MVATIDRNLIRTAKNDIDVFARHIVSAPLWPHQLDLATSTARIRAVCSGRQAGKSRTLAVLALHQAFSEPGSKTLILSAGEEAAKVLLQSIVELLSAPLLAGSTVEENKSRIVLSTGSEIVCVPASTRQVRGRSIDLLVMDEANFMPAELWTAASFTVLARPGSRVVMASSPWTRDHFFTTAYNAGRNGASGYEAFHWPSTASPHVDADLLEQFRQTMTSRDYSREVLAEWVDDVGAYFTTTELDNAVADYTQTPPDKAHGQLAVAGIDWGMANDANALALLGVLDDHDLNQGRHGAELVYFIPWIEAHHKMPYSAFIKRICEVATGYRIQTVVSETNGVGQMPTEVLRDELREHQHTTRGHVQVFPAITTNRRKMSGFGAIKLLLQQGRLILPRHPELLKQLHALEYEMTDTGTTKISVPERAGHDDLAMALMQAVSTISNAQAWRPDNPRPQTGPTITTPTGTQLHQHPRCWNLPLALRRNRGRDKTDGW